MPANILDQSVRKSIIDEIIGEDNTSRKRFEQRKFDIYRNRQDRYVLERLQEEFGPKSMQTMRKVLSINPLPRIIDEQASLYSNEPDRHFSGASDEQIEYIENLYHYGMVDSSMRQANRFYKLFNQSFLWLVPHDGKLCPRALTPKDIDVIPMDDNPEKAYCYIMSTWNIDMQSSYLPMSSVENSYFGNDQLNQKIADDNDRKPYLERYVWWSDEYHFTTNGYGEFVGDVIANPIGQNPFIDIAAPGDKDFQFFVRRGSSAAEFTIDLLTQLSDLSNISRLQGYSQAIIYSAEEPKDVRVGPSKVLWLKLDPNNPNARPEFAFESPSPDLNASLEILNTQLKMFLSSLGLDPGVVSGKNDAKTFTSGVDHLLANLDKFQASRQDMDLFRYVETKYFDLLVKWNNVMQPVSGDGRLMDDIRGPQLPESIEMEVHYKEPMAVQTQSEKEDSLLKLLEAGLISKGEVLQKLFGVDEEGAEKMLAEIQEEADQRYQSIIKAQSQTELSEAEGESQKN